MEVENAVVLVDGFNRSIGLTFARKVYPGQSVHLAKRAAVALAITKR